LWLVLPTWVETSERKLGWWDKPFLFPAVSGKEVFMDDIIAGILAGVMALVLVFAVAVFGGTLVWIIWPVVNNAFPTAVSQGWIAGHLSWWDSVSLTWLCGILIKSTQTNNAKK